MVDVNTIVGDPVEAPDETVIIPVSRVACGFAAGGGDFDTAEAGNGQGQEEGGGGTNPFGGGSGAGVSVQPVGFLVVGNGQIRLLSVDGNSTVDRLIDMAPQMVSQVQGILSRKDNQQKQYDFEGGGI